jgi:hypothetical protein
MNTVQITADIRAMIAENPVTVVSGSSTVSAHRTKVVYGEISGDYGAVEEYSFSVRAIAADFTSLPKTGDVITVSGVSRRVLAPGGDLDSAGVSVLIHLGGLAQ